MARGSSTKVLLHILNVLYTLLGFAIAATSIWFFVQIYDLTSLRNANHYLLDFRVTWPQAVPWIFFFASVLVLCAAGCGFAGAKKGSKRLVLTFIYLFGFALFLLVAAAVVALIFADNDNTDKFIKDAMWDAHTHARTDQGVESSFGVIERKLQCCGAESPRDYINWKNEFPQSCCDTYYHGWLGTYPLLCEFTNRLPNERHGCSTVAAQYSRIVIKVLSGASILTALFGIIGLIVAVVHLKALKTKSRILAGQMAAESKKNLL